MKSYLTSFFDEFTYPDEARLSLTHAYDKISESEKSGGIFFELLDKYECDKVIFKHLDRISESLKIHRYTIHLLYHVCLSKKLRIMYSDKNIPYQIYFDSMSDLKWKLAECHNLHGIWGSFVADWFKGFFTMERFALGRLQFEIREFESESDYSKNGNVLKKGDPVINMHIPSSGPLDRNECLSSYKKAAEFFKDHFKSKPVAFVCNSWLLFPKHYDFLPEKSNIRKFMADFDIISDYTDKKFSDMWRVFNVNFTGDVSVLPTDTSLRKAYYEWLKNGNQVGGGYGVFFFDGTNII